MIEQNPNIELHLCKQDVEKYLLTHGWHQVEHPNKKLKVFDGVLDDEGQPFRLVLPMNERTRATTLRIYQAVQTIAGVEDRSITAVAADIRSDNANVSNQDYDQVIKSWNWIAKLFKIPNWYWNSLAMLKVGEARLKQTLKENPNSCEGLHNLGLNLNRQARYEEAISSFDQALEIKPDYYLSWHNRGIALYNLRKYEEAISSYDQALEIKPDYDRAHDEREIACSAA